MQLARVNSDHFQQALKDMRPLLTATPKIISRLVDGDGWDAMGELLNRLVQNP